MNRSTALLTIGIGLAALGVIVGLTVPVKVCAITAFSTKIGCRTAPNPFPGILTWTLIVGGLVVGASGLQARRRT
ncbi:MAG TPA: hypothetical protein VGK35_05080 [Actinotalea sp.]|jgi:hypothetical protein